MNKFMQSSGTYQKKWLKSLFGCQKLFFLLPTFTFNDFLLFSSFPSESMSVSEKQIHAKGEQKFREPKNLIMSYLLKFSNIHPQLMTNSLFTFNNKFNFLKNTSKIFFIFKHELFFFACAFTNGFLQTEFNCDNKIISMCRIFQVLYMRMTLVLFPVEVFFL